MLGPEGIPAPGGMMGTCRTCHTGTLNMNVLIRIGYCDIISLKMFFTKHVFPNDLPTI